MVTVLLAGLSRLAQAITCTWVATAPGNFSDPLNWSPAAVPGAGDAAHFNNSSAMACNLDTNFQGDLTISGSYSGTITQSSAASPTSFTQNGGTFVVNGSSLNVAGSFSQIGGSFDATAAGSSVTVGGSFGQTGGTYHAGSSTLTLAASGSPTLFAASPLFNLLITQGNWSLGIDLTVNGSLTLFAAGTNLSLGSRQLAVNGGGLNIGSGDTLDTGSGAGLYTGPSCPINLSAVGRQLHRLLRRLDPGPRQLEHRGRRQLHRSWHHESERRHGRHERG
jgi:hypothetical protein